MKEKLIRFEDVGFAYGDRVVLEHFSWTVGAGETVAMLGRNGSGKTTTLSLLTGQLAAGSGSIFMGECKIHPEALDVKRRMAFVPSVHEIYEYLTGEEYVDFVCGLWGMTVDESRKASQVWFDRFDLETRRATRAGDYSHGMQQRLVLVAALSHGPEVLVLDEPLIGLDIESASMLKRVIKEREAEGLTTIVSTHLLEGVRDIARRVVILHEGRVVASGLIEEIAQNLRVQGIEEIFRICTQSSTTSGAV